MSFRNYGPSHSNSYRNSNKRFHPYKKKSFQNVDDDLNQEELDKIEMDKNLQKTGNQFGIKVGQQGSSLRSIDWTLLSNARYFQRNFYDGANHTCEKTKEEIEEWKKENKIKIFFGFNHALNDANFRWNKKFHDTEKDDWYNSFNNSAPPSESTATVDSDEAKEELESEEKVNISTRVVLPNPVFQFDDIAYPNYIKQEILKEGFTAPTPIQSQAWPIILSGCDMIGIAQTGSGKTLAFLLPAMIHIHAQMKGKRVAHTNSNNGGFGGRAGRGRGRGRGRAGRGSFFKPRGHGLGPIALVVAPTRELAMQIEEECDKFCGTQMKHVCVYGGAPRYTQKAKLVAGVEIAIATPGRLLDFVETNTVSLKTVTYLVIDEADRMLDMGFEPQLNCILNQIRPDRQLCLFSATWPVEVRNLAKKYVKKNTKWYPNDDGTNGGTEVSRHCENNLIQISIGGDLNQLNCNKDVTQEIIMIDRFGKIDKLKEILLQYKDDAESKVLVFVSTKRMCNKMNDILWENGFYCTCIHGDKEQHQRTRALNQFKSGDLNIMLATDVASRGIHVDNIVLVLNFDFPMHIADYVHRIGRTGRAGKKGKSISFFTRGEDDKRVHDLIKVLKQSKQEIPEELFTIQKSGRKGGGRRGYGGYGRGRRGRGGRRGGRGRGRFNGRSGNRGGKGRGGYGRY